MRILFYKIFDLIKKFENKVELYTNKIEKFETELRGLAVDQKNKEAINEIEEIKIYKN